MHIFIELYHIYKPYGIVQTCETISYFLSNIWEETVAKKITKTEVQHDSDTEVVPFEPALHVEMSCHGRSCITFI